MRAISVSCFAVMECRSPGSTNGRGASRAGKVFQLERVRAEVATAVQPVAHDPDAGEFQRRQSDARVAVASRLPARDDKFGPAVVQGAGRTR
jgi:hypothetical protein